MGHKLIKILLGMIFLTSLNSFADGPREEFTWYDDNGVAHKIFKDVYHLSIIHNKKEIHVDRARKEELKNFMPKAILVNESPMVSIYKSDKPLLKEANVNNSSPVFALSQESAPELVLMGGVSVTFKKDITQEKIKEFFSDNDITVLQVIKYAKRTVYYIDAPPGVESLEKANDLRKHDIIQSAVPSFGQPVILR